MAIFSVLIISFSTKGTTEFGISIWGAASKSTGSDYTCISSAWVTVDTESPINSLR